MPIAVVDALIADADRQISALEREAAEALAAADASEAQLLELNVDERSSAWAMAQLDRFVVALRAEADAEAAAAIQEAEITTPGAAGAEPVAEPSPVTVAVPPPVAVAENPSDGIFDAIAPEALANADPLEFSGDADFWPPETKPTRRLSRPNRRVLVTQGAAALLLVAAVALRLG
jgi:hypothetical protein